MSTTKFCVECGEICRAPFNTALNDNTLVYCKKDFDRIIKSGSGAMPSKTIFNDPKMGYCSKCTKKIDGDFKVVAGKHYHVSCFKCDLCHKDLGSAFFERVGNVYCQYCNIEINNDLELQKRLGPSATVLQNDNKEFNQTNRELYQNIQKGKESHQCTWCKKSIGDGQFVKFNDVVYHHNCFTCGQCQSIIGSKSFSQVPGLSMPLCQNCATSSPKKSSSNSESCMGCGKSISGAYTKIPDQGVYHKDCFRCNQCNSTLEKGYAMVAGKATCADCVPKQTGGTLSPGRTKGFVIDKRSGKKTFL
ncbi:hypothetical protein DLAC_04852 [Tieghemostelium lacteum]|uniref:LIM zinc-binding domain-containing protein n=1 Tax=Tieghemostelium lacteum TaxID=361077 RepID=A0A151ZIY8_TIELA|nr:hypothetical protein DLAC_04852 [Tieghemostelium lacteum]|eukprot:KYQ93961.1 hypothetical protein DLAC_04852 [Tieghemostelium lacteum]